MSESEFFHRLDVRVGGLPVREMRHNAIQERKGAKLSQMEGGWRRLYINAGG